MKSMIRCPKSGNVSSKRVLSIIFGVAAVVGLFIPSVDNTSIIALATLSLGQQGLTKNLNLSKNKEDGKQV